MSPHEASAVQRISVAQLFHVRIYTHVKHGLLTSKTFWRTASVSIYVSTSKTSLTTPLSRQKMNGGLTRIILKCCTCSIQGDVPGGGGEGAFTVPRVILLRLPSTIVLCYDQGCSQLGFSLVVPNPPVKWALQTYSYFVFRELFCRC